MDQRPEGPRRCGDDRGAVIVELALVAPFLVLLVLGVFEFGNVYRNRTLLAGSLRSSARVVSQSGTVARADQVALTSFYATASKLKNATLQKVIIYKASSTSGKPDPTCLTASTSGSAPYGVSGLCNVYTPTQVANASLVASNGNYGCVSSASYDYKWCVSARNLTPANADYVGVYAEYKYTGVTTILPVRTITLSDYSVYRMEPDV